MKRITPPQRLARLAPALPLLAALLAASCGNGPDTADTDASTLIAECSPCGSENQACCSGAIHPEPGDFPYKEYRCSGNGINLRCDPRDLVCKWCGQPDTPCCPIPGSSCVAGYACQDGNICTPL